MDSYIRALIREFYRRLFADSPASPRYQRCLPLKSHRFAPVFRMKSRTKTRYSCVECAFDTSVVPVNLRNDILTYSRKSFKD